MEEIQTCDGRSLTSPLRFISKPFHGSSEKAGAVEGTRHPQGSPDDGRGDFSTEEDAERADGVRGEHADDGERHRELPVQGVSQDCAQE